MNSFKRFIFEIFLVLFHTYCIFESSWYLWLGGIRRPRVFRGYFSLWFAKHYADKRHDRWKPSWDQSGKRQGVMPYTDTTLIVASPGELKLYGKRNFLRKGINPRKLIKKAYYTTPL